MKKLPFLKWTALAVLILVAVGCKEQPLQLKSDTAYIGGVDPSPGGGGIGTPPTVTSFSPGRGIGGTIVTITGSKFSSTPANNIVKFDGVQAQVTSATTVNLTVNVPLGATSGKISVMVSGLLGTSSTDFIVIDIPLSGLVAFYPFDGNANDISANQLHGTVTGAVLSADRLGKANSSFLFDGSGDYINMGNPVPLQIANSITLAVWVKLSNDNFGIQNILTKLSPLGGPSNPSGKDGYQFSKNTGPGRIYATMFAYSPPACYGYFNSREFQVSNWVFLTITRNGATSRFYQNGLLVSEGEGSFTTCPLNSVQGNFYVGKADGATGLGAGSFAGNIDDVAIYNRAISADEVMKLYQQNILQ